MASEDLGSGLENSTHINQSSSRPKNSPDTIKEGEVPTAEETKQTFAQPSQISPRQYHESRSATPSPSPPISSSASSSVSSSSTSSASSSSTQHEAPLPRPAPEAAAEPPLSPPVTKATLSELDVNKIVSNPKLRHDINFDPDLHFRPNVDGHKGRRKQEKADLFWKKLRTQLEVFLVDRPRFIAQYGSDANWCLPQLLRVVKDIILTLVPQRDRGQLEEGLNVELLMQQFEHGVADLQKLATWLSKVLKSHCAPMRDEWVNGMYNQLSRGDQNNDIGELVQGMRSLLSVLEAMKLDVANHQIRCLRPALIEDTVNFEQKYFYKKIQNRKLDVAAAKNWFATCAEEMAHTTNNTSVFFEAMSRFVLPSCTDKPLPNTFLFDEERLAKLRSDMIDAINMEICMRMYEDLERVSSATTAVHSAVVPTESSEGDSLVTSRPSSFTFTAPTAANPTSESTFATASPTVIGLPPSVVPSSPIGTGGSREAKKDSVYQSLLALLQTAPPTSRPTARWQALAPAVALQIFRNVQAPASLLSTFESQLTDTVLDVTTSLHREVEASMHRQLLRELSKKVSEFRVLSGVNLFSTATGTRNGPTTARLGLGAGAGAEPRSRGEDVLMDIAKRMAHVGLLHWKVWGPLVYLVPDSAPASGPTSGPSGPGSGSASESSGSASGSASESGSSGSGSSGSVSSSVDSTSSVGSTSQ